MCKHSKQWISIYQYVVAVVVVNSSSMNNPFTCIYSLFYTPHLQRISSALSTPNHWEKFDTINRDAYMYLGILCQVYTPPFILAPLDMTSNNIEHQLPYTPTQYCLHFTKISSLPIFFFFMEVVVYFAICQFFFSLSLSFFFCDCQLHWLCDCLVFLVISY